jgi:hypothetical protein
MDSERVRTDLKNSERAADKQRPEDKEEKK